MKQDMEELTGRLSDPGTTSTLPAASMAGSLSASLIARVCSAALENGATGKAEEGLTDAHGKALLLRRDLVALADHGAEADRLMRERRPASDRERLKDLLFASEIPFRIALSCHALMQLSLKVLGRVGLKGIGEIGTASSLAFAGVVGATMVARTSLSEITCADLGRSALTRERAERILREADATRAHITERVLKHLP